MLIEEVILLSQNYQCDKVRHETVPIVYSAFGIVALLSTVNLFDPRIQDSDRLIQRHVQAR